MVKLKRSVIFYMVFAFFLGIYAACGGGDHDDSDTSASEDKTVFHSPETLYEDLVAINSAYPEITAIKTIGTSTEGREIYSFIISDNPTVNEQEPRIRLTGTIHGDENITTELLYKMVQYLTENYATDSRVGSLINERYLSFVLMLNPDGVAANSRYTNNGVDLNRNFDYKWISSITHGSGPFSEPESRAIRDQAQSTIFHLSATYHSGEVIVNIPYDYAKESDGVIPQEYTLIKNVAKVYATSGTFLLNEDLMSGSIVDEGVVNGGDWYIVNGSLQDWSLVKTGCIDLTIEVSLKKNGHSYEELNEIYAFNKDSILAYIETAGRGVSGLVVNSQGQFISGAKVYIENGDVVTYSDGDGFFHKILLPGTYTLYVDAAGYSVYSQQVTVADSIVSEKIDVVLQPL